jgi:serine/threonine protein kinase
MRPDVTDGAVDELTRRVEAWPLLSQPIEVALAPVVADLAAWEHQEPWQVAIRRDASWSILYEEIHPLGRGGIGRTILARERLSDRRVCIKELFRDVDVRMLEQEYLALSRMSHPNIVRVLQLAPHGEPPYMVTEYVEGVNILEHAAGLARDEQTIARLIRPVFDALATLHAKEIIHRDIKPENILVSKQTGEPVVIDLGLAVVDRVDHEGRLTAEGLRIYGTPAYMSPEQMSGEKLKPACDVYALGVVTYELVTRHCPFPSSQRGAWDAKMRATSGLSVPDRFWRPRWRTIRGVIRECTDPDRAKRPSAAAVRDRLDRLIVL